MLQHTVALDVSLTKIGLLPLLRVPELAATCSGWSTSTRWIRHSSNSFASSQPGTNGDNKIFFKKSDTVDKTFVFSAIFFCFHCFGQISFFFTFREMTRPLTRSTHARLSTGGRRCDVGDVGDAAAAARACADRPTLAIRSRWLVR